MELQTRGDCGPAARQTGGRRGWQKSHASLTQNGELPMEVVCYEYIVLVSTLPYEVAALVPVYRERGDAENPFDELQNQPNQRETR